MRRTIYAIKVEELILERLGPVEKKYQPELAARDDKLASATKQLEVLLIDQGVTVAAAAAGARVGAIPDLINRARAISKVVEGKVQLVDGDRVLYGDDARTPLDYPAWLKQMAPKPEYQHLFEPSTGGNSKNDPGKLPAGTKSMPRSHFETLDAGAKATAMKEKVVLTEN